MAQENKFKKVTMAVAVEFGLLKSTEYQLYTLSMLFNTVRPDDYIVQVDMTYFSQ